ncbi:hemogen isoform X2 [Rana temporaria]|uniref:hemogen isoform X2 n=1 Tax=Rana temporaria TaxID=8407 RepID=UPI001AAD8430|nr:hemogen isoform X2 [Rana temporaria]
MDGFKIDHHSLEEAEHSAPASQHHEEKKEAQVISPRRLRDRELLKRKKEESREKDTYFEQTQTRSKRPRQTRGTGSRRRKQVIEPEPQLEPQPEPEPNNEPDHKHEQAAEPQHEPEPNHEDEQAAEAQHEPEPKNKPDHEQATYWQHEFISENKLALGYDAQQVLSQQEPLEHLEHHEDPVVSATEGETAEETYAVHEEADGHFQREITSLITDKEEVAEVEPEPLIAPSEVLKFPEQEEHQYYTPLL